MAPNASDDLKGSYMVYMARTNHDFLRSFYLAQTNSVKDRGVFENNNWTRVKFTFNIVCVLTFLAFMITTYTTAWARDQATTDAAFPNVGALEEGMSSSFYLLGIAWIVASAVYQFVVWMTCGFVDNDGKTIASTVPFITNNFTYGIVILLITAAEVTYVATTPILAPWILYAVAVLISVYILWQREWYNARETLRLHAMIFDSFKMKNNPSYDERWKNFVTVLRTFKFNPVIYNPLEYILNVVDMQYITVFVASRFLTTLMAWAYGTTTPGPALGLVHDWIIGIVFTGLFFLLGSVLNVTYAKQAAFAIITGGYLYFLSSAQWPVDAYFAISVTGFVMASLLIIAGCTMGGMQIHFYEKLRKAKFAEFTLLVERPTVKATV